MQYLWTALIVVFLILESATPQLIGIWFAGGALVSLLISLFVDNITIQIICFLAVSSILLYLTRPLTKKFKEKAKQRTNINSIIGKDAKVTEDISNIDSTGAVMLDGKEWSARSIDGSVISAGAIVTVEELKGVKLIVKNK